MSDLRVFISHTSDLATSPDSAPSFVATAIGTIAALEGFSAEEQSTTFAAEDQTSAETCRRRLAGCDIYLGIVGFERGTQVKGDEAARSFVEFEFDVARELNIPRIVLMFDLQDGQHLPATQRQSEFRSRLVSTQEIVFERFANQAELRSDIQRALIPFQLQTSEHVSCHIEWARPNELSGLGIDPGVRRWGVYVRNGGDYPAYNILAAVRSNNGGEAVDIDMGTLAARDVTSSPYVLNLEAGSFDPDGDRPVVYLYFTVTGVCWHRRPDGSLVRERNKPSLAG
jgi:hypothetical protein